MSQYRYIGRSGQIWDTPYVFSKFGQLVEISDELAAKVPLLIPAKDFDNVGINPDHLKLYGDVATHKNAPADFIQKRNQLWAMTVPKETLAAEVVAEEEIHNV